MGYFELVQCGDPVINGLSAARLPSMGQRDSCLNGPLLELDAVLIFDD